MGLGRRPETAHFRFRIFRYSSTLHVYAGYPVPGRSDGVLDPVGAGRLKLMKGPRPIINHGSLKLLEPCIFPGGLRPESPHFPTESRHLAFCWPLAVSLPSRLKAFSVCFRLNSNVLTSKRPEEPITSLPARSRASFRNKSSIVFFPKCFLAAFPYKGRV